MLLPSSTTIHLTSTQTAVSAVLKFVLSVCLLRVQFLQNVLLHLSCVETSYVLSWPRLIIRITNVLTVNVGSRTEIRISYLMTLWFVNSRHYRSTVFAIIKLLLEMHSEAVPFAFWWHFALKYPHIYLHKNRANICTYGHDSTCSQYHSSNL